MRTNRTGGGSRWAVLGDQAQRRHSSICIASWFAQTHKPRLPHRLPATVLYTRARARVGPVTTTRSFPKNALQQLGPCVTILRCFWNTHEGDNEDE